MDQNIKRARRRKILKILVDRINKGEFDSFYPTLEQLFRLHTSNRQEYVPPYQRDTDNYGYMNGWEMGANDESF